MITRKRLRRIAAGAFVYAIAVPEGQIGVRYHLFCLTGTGNLSVSGRDFSIKQKMLPTTADGGLSGAFFLFDRKLLGFLSNKKIVTPADCPFGVGVCEYESGAAGAAAKPLSCLKLSGRLKVQTAVFHRKLKADRQRFARRADEQGVAAVVQAEAHLAVVIAEGFDRQRE